MIRRPPRSTHCISSAASDVYKRQEDVLVIVDIYQKTNKLRGILQSLNSPKIEEILYCDRNISQQINSAFDSNNENIFTELNSVKEYICQLLENKKSLLDFYSNNEIDSLLNQIIKCINQFSKQKSSFKGQFFSFKSNLKIEKNQYMQLKRFRIDIKTGLVKKLNHKNVNQNEKEEYKIQKQDNSSFIVSCFGDYLWRYWHKSTICYKSNNWKQTNF
eukprot:TRINITY_DN20073_c0_g1_i1.p2 TRINITY_DN20073_c0_g1~~TRINITY_DN20073_c0_g1_i1.p2  ORF type:complete len:217 (+),score=41.82 TRINITY_DN20073_c0_g1_i1:137-787(+)